MKTVGYARVSTVEQADNGISLDVQRAKIDAMATVHGSELVAVLIDGGESAKNLNRPGMAELLALVDGRAVDTVIVYKLDRLTRSVRDLGELLERFEKKNVTLISVSESLDTSTATGRMVLNIMMSVSQWEREAIAERTRDALQHKKSKGQRVGNIPFGYRLADDGQTLEPEPAEQNVCGIVRELRSAGYSLRAIAHELNRQGLTTRKGTAWVYQYVDRIAKAA